MDAKSTLRFVSSDDGTRTREVVIAAKLPPPLAGRSRRRSSHDGYRPDPGRHDPLRSVMTEVGMVGYARERQFCDHSVWSTRIDPRHSPGRLRCGHGSSTVGESSQVHHRRGPRTGELHRVDSRAVGKEVVRRVDVRSGLGAHGYLEHVVSIAVDGGRGAELRNGIARVDLGLRADGMGQVDDSPYAQRHAGGSLAGSAGASVKRLI